jgi:hypothetical protein
MYVCNFEEINKSIFAVIYGELWVHHIANQLFEHPGWNLVQYAKGILSMMHQL